MTTTLSSHDVVNHDNLLYYLDPAGQVRTVCPAQQSAAVARWPMGLAEFLAAWEALTPTERAQRWARALSGLRPVRIGGPGPFLVGKNRAGDGRHPVFVRHGIRFGTALVELVGHTRTPTGAVQVIAVSGPRAAGYVRALRWTCASDFFACPHIDLIPAAAFQFIS